MQNILGAVTMALLMLLVIARLASLKRAGVQGMKFGQLDKTDFLIPPFALFYFYTIFAAAFGWPLAVRGQLFYSSVLAWLGVLLCAAGLALMAWSLVSFGRSFRVGIDTDRPDALITNGAFAVSRNPIYMAFGLVLLGQFLIFPNAVMLAYLLGGAWLLNRQVLREEEFLRQHYGPAYHSYSQKVRRYL